MQAAEEALHGVFLRHGSGRAVQSHRGAEISGRVWYRKLATFTIINIMLYGGEGGEGEGGRTRERRGGKWGEGGRRR